MDECQALLDEQLRSELGRAHVPRAAVARLRVRRVGQGRGRPQSGQGGLQRNGFPRVALHCFRGDHFSAQPIRGFTACHIVSQRVTACHSVPQRVTACHSVSQRVNGCCPHMCGTGGGGASCRWGLAPKYRDAPQDVVQCAGFQTLFPFSESIKLFTVKECLK